MNHSYRLGRSMSAVTIALFALLSGAPAVGQSRVFFVRGDTNADGAINISDPVATLSYLFLGGGLPCLRAADTDDDGALNLSDPVALLNFSFQGGEPPAPPAGECGEDTTADTLSCESFPPCEFETVVARYGVLRTIAGTGTIRGKDVNGWEERFEGGAAVDAELSRPHFAMRDAAGRLFIADKDAHAVRMVDGEGVITTIAGISAPGDGSDEPGPGAERALNHPNGLWVLADGTVYILDVSNAKVRRLTPDGSLSTLFSVPGGVVVGRGIWVAEDESLAYVCSASVVKRWTPEGGVEDFSSGYTELGTLVIDPDGNVAVTDRGDDLLEGGNRVYRVDAEGVPTPIAGSGESFGGGDGDPALETALHGVRSIWYLDTGGYLLATHEGSQIWYVDTSGIIHLFLDGRDDHSHSGDGEHFRTPGTKISEPRAVTVDAAGNIIVTENDYGYIREIERVTES